MTRIEAGQSNMPSGEGIALEVPGRFAWRVLELVAIGATCYLVARVYEMAAPEILLHRIPFWWYGSMTGLELAMVVSMATCIVLPVSLLFVLSVCVARCRYGLNLQQLGWHLGYERGAVLKAASLGVAGGLLWYVGMWWVDELPPDLRYTGFIGPRLSHVWPTYAAIGVILSASEETFFRGLLYRLLRARLGPVSAALLSCAVFVVWHPQIVGRPPLAIPIFVFGLLYCDIFERSKSLVVSQAAHASLNVTGMILMNTA